MTTMQCCRGWDMLEATLAGEATATPPVAFWRHHPVADQNARDFADSTVAFQRKVDCDFVKITPASSFQLRDYGLEDEWRPDGVGRRTILHKPVIHSSDWPRLPRLDYSDSFAGRMVTAARDIRKRIDASTPVLQTIFSPVFQAQALSADPLRQHVHEHLAQGLAAITDNTIALIEAFLEAGVDGFYFAIQHAQPATLPWPGFLEWAWGYDEACLRAMGDSLAMVHLHGNGGVFLDACPPDVDILHYDLGARGNPPLAEAMRRFPGAIAGPAASWPGRRFVYSPACATPLDTPDDYWAEAVRRIRQEPR